MAAKAQSGAAGRTGPLDIYAYLLVVSAVILAVGVTVLALRNTEASSLDGQQGGPFELIRQ